MTRVAIAGGGIGGLAVGIGLIKAGFGMTIFERSERLPETGTGLGIWPSAMRALDQLGVGAEARRVGRLQQSGKIRRPDGSPIATIDVEKVGVYLLSRPVLLRLLADALPYGAVRFGEPVTNVDDLRRDYDVVVGADGIRSLVRTAVFGAEAQLRYSGWMTWRGTGDLDLAAGGETWGLGKKFGVTPQEPGRTNWYAALHVPENYCPADDLTELEHHFGAWHEPIPQLLAQFADAEVLRHELHYLGPLKSYVRGNVALLGDAAHAMTPDLGQGACQALIDGAALADCLARATDIQSGLATYDQLRRKPSQRIAAMALRASRLAAMRQTGLRNLLLRAALSIGPPA